MPNLPNSHVRHVIYLVGLLLLLGLGTLWLYIAVDLKFTGHLAAIFFEVALSVTIVEVYLARARRKETLRIYAVTRSYILDNLFVPFNRVLTQSLPDQGFLRLLGQTPSDQLEFRQKDYWKSLAEDFLNRIDDQSVLQIVQVFDTYFSRIEKAANLNMVYHSDDLFLSIVHFLDAASAIRLYLGDGFTDAELLDATRTGQILPGKARNVREDYLQLIASWLYILNNFIYFSTGPELVWNKMDAQTATVQSEYLETKPKAPGVPK